MSVEIFGILCGFLISLGFAWPLNGMLVRNFFRLLEQSQLILYSKTTPCKELRMLNVAY